MNLESLTINVSGPLNNQQATAIAALVGFFNPAKTSADVKTAAAGLQPPKIGEMWLAQGGIYAGISSEGGDHHLVLCTTEPPAILAWQAARDWAAGLAVEGFTDWGLPTRFESALLYANLRDRFDTAAWHWTDTQYSDDYAYDQYFGYGGQSDSDKSFKAKARAVRRLPL
jgi:hypothetical protein